MTTNSQISTTEPNRNKNKLREQLEQEQNHRHGDHVEGYQQGWGEGREGGKVQGVRSIIGKYKIDRRRLDWCRKWRSQRTSVYNPWT